MFLSNSFIEFFLPILRFKCVTCLVYEILKKNDCIRNELYIDCCLLIEFGTQ